MGKFCSSCKHWNLPNSLRVYKDWADCFCVVAALQENLLSCINERGEPFRIPFDPNDERLFKVDTRFRDETKKIKDKIRGHTKIKIERVNGKTFFKTSRDFECKYYTGGSYALK